jgi:cytosine/uracil/thiamine/allantoin permease
MNDLSRQSELEAFRAAQKKRSLAIALALFGFVAIVFIITMVKLQGHALNKPF